MRESRLQFSLYQDARLHSCYPGTEKDHQGFRFVLLRIPYNYGGFSDKLHESSRDRYEFVILILFRSQTHWQRYVYAIPQGITGVVYQHYVIRIEAWSQNFLLLMLRTNQHTFLHLSFNRQQNTIPQMSFHSLVVNMDDLECNRGVTIDEEVETAEPRTLGAIASRER